MSDPWSNATAVVLNQFGELVANEFSALNVFINLLQTEQQMLGTDKAENLAQSLTPLAEQKTLLCRQLEDLGRQRQLFLARHGLPPERAAIENGIASRPALLAAWQDCLQAARQAQSLNAQNGKLINLRLQHNRAAMNVLLTAADRVAVYGPDGHQPGGFGRGRLWGSG